MKEMISKFIEECAGKGYSPVMVYCLLVVALLIASALAVLAYVLLYRLTQKLVHLAFARMEKKQGHRIHVVFLEKLTSLAIGLAVIIAFIGWENVGGSLLGSAAVLTGIIGFAAQDIIGDILSGLLISIYKPFDLGDRIELDDGTAGIVESITMRHVVITKMDTLRVVIPNSRINAAAVSNFSYGDVELSCIFHYTVDKASDLEKTKAVLSEAIKSSPYSVPGIRGKDGSRSYGDIYFTELNGQAMKLSVTVYYESGILDEKLKDDINSRVFQAFNENGVELV